MCMEPVGEGAIRVTTGRSDIELGEPLGEAATAGAGAAALSTRDPRRPRVAAWDWLAAQAERQAARRRGWVVDVASPGAGGQRLLIAPARIGDWPAALTPIRVRVTLRGGYVPAPGEPIRLLAVINPPPPPASPGAYDFARDAWFESVGGV